MIRVGERLETLAQSGSIFTNGLGLLYIKSYINYNHCLIQFCTDFTRLVVESLYAILSARSEARSERNWTRSQKQLTG
jgi:hypothetical protein